MNKLGFIGMGNMAQALAEGFIKAGAIDKAKVFAFAPNQEKLQKNSARIGFTPCATLTELAAAADTLVMACTHYPLLTKVIKEVMGDDVVLVNTGEATAQVVKDLLSREGTASEGNSDPVREFYTSDEPELFEQVAAPFLGEGLPSGTKHFSTDKYEVTV